MKQFQHTATLILASFFALSFSSCGEQDEVMNHTENDEKGIAIESITATLQGMQSEAQGATTRADIPMKEGFSVNREGIDPTYASIEDRGKAGWKMDFTLYNGDDKYNDGSFTGATYSESKWTWEGQKYFPHYKKPDAEAMLYPTNVTSSSGIAKNQSEKAVLLAQDTLIKLKGPIDSPLGHAITVNVEHKHSMLDFVIKNVNIQDFKDVKVSMDNGNKFDYIPYTAFSESTPNQYNIEYMLIVPAGSKFNPIVQITTKESASNSQSITYKQTIDILKIEKDKKLVANSCYCFTLQGADLKISPITILNWATGESLPGEYIAVTAYPTFKAKGYENQTFYFYYDSKLKEGTEKEQKDKKPKLQTITFNENAECTIKPDGRILTHIYTENQVDPIEGSENKTPKEGINGELSPHITLGEMVVDVEAAIKSIVTK